MATTPNPAPLEEELPWTHEVDQADQKLGSFLSDLDLIASSVKRFEGDPISLEEHARLVREGLEPPKRELRFDLEAFSRLLVFADELGSDAERMKECAAEMRQALLWIYRTHVLEAKIGGGRDA